MEDFYKTFKDNLENRPEPAFNERAWQTMQSQLDALDQSKSRVVVWPWWSYAMLALLPLSIFLNAWLFMQRSDEPTRFPKEASMTLLQPDTVIQTKLVYQRDTIVQVRIIREQVERANHYANSWLPALEQNLQKQFDRFGQTALSMSDSGIPTDQQAGTQFSTKQLLEALRQDIGAGEKPVDQGLALLSQPQLSISMDQSSAEPNMQGLPISAFHYTPPPLWHQLQPEGATIGAGFGLLIPTTAEMEDPHAIQRAVTLKLRMPNKWAVWGEFGLLDIRYILPDVGASYEIAPAESPADNFEFREVKVSQERWHWGAGLAYAFSSKAGAGRPTLGVGYNALGYKPYEVFYKFQDINTGTEIRVEERVDRQDNPAHYLSFKAGYQWPIGKACLWDLSLDYKYSLGRNKYSNPNLVGITSNFSFQF